MNPNENILVVNTDLFHRLGWFQGFSQETEKYRHELLSPENIHFQKRGLAENEPKLKQLIPYMIFSWTNPQGEIFLFAYVRGKGQGESRLHSRMSIGVGGHINDGDFLAGSKDPYREGMFREFREEVTVNSDYQESCVGMINDDQTEVGRVHLGIVHRFELKEPNVAANEPDLLSAGFHSVTELLALPEERFETWSWIVLNALFNR